MQSEPHDGSLDVLLVEDDPIESFLAGIALKGCRHRHRLHVVQTGLEALQYLRREGPHADAPRPDVIIMDMDLPVMDGRELLKILKMDPAYKQIPVVALTNSANQDDIFTCLEHAVCYFVLRPTDLDGYFRAIRHVENLWSTNVRLAPRPVAIPSWRRMAASEA